MDKKVVWIVNEYNSPDAIKSRQTNLCSLLNQLNYDTYIISGSTSNKGNANKLKTTERFRYVETDEAKGYIIKTSNYKRSIERVLVAIQFQKRIWKLRNILPKPDVIVSDFAGIFGYVFLKWKWKYGTRIIYDILDLWPEGFVELGYLKKNSLITKSLYWFEHKTYKCADGIIFSFQGGKDYIKDKGWSTETGGDVDTSHIGYLNNGVDLETVDKQAKTYVYEDPDLDSNLFKVVYLGSISTMNGLDVLVEAAKCLQDRGDKNVVILVYGYGNQESILKKRVSDYGLSNIRFKGRVDRQYAMSILTRSNLNIFTFKDSPMWKYGISPNKLFMYFASGKPVLSMIRPEYDLVEGRHAGISVENNPEIVADTIERFSRMTFDEYDCYCRNARIVAKEYDYKNLVHVLIDHIEGERFL